MTTPPHATPPTPRSEGSTMTTCKRKCHDCGNVADHEDNVIPYVLCKVCGSRDTRPVKPAPGLHALIDSARAYVMTPEEREAQRQSFATGNVGEEREGERRTVMVKTGISRENRELWDKIKKLQRGEIEAKSDYERWLRDDFPPWSPDDVAEALVNASVIDALRRRLAIAETRAGELEKRVEQLIDAGDGLTDPVRPGNCKCDECLKAMANWNAAKAGGGA